MLSTSPKKEVPLFTPPCWQACWGSTVLANLAYEPLCSHVQHWHVSVLSLRLHSVWIIGQEVGDFQMCILNMLVVTIISVWERRTSTSKIEIMGSIVSGGIKESHCETNCYNLGSGCLSLMFCGHHLLLIQNLLVDPSSNPFENKGKPEYRVITSDSAYCILMIWVSWCLCLWCDCFFQFQYLWHCVLCVHLKTAECRNHEYLIPFIKPGNSLKNAHIWPPGDSLVYLKRFQLLRLPLFPWRNWVGRRLESYFLKLSFERILKVTPVGPLPEFVQAKGNISFSTATPGR